MYWKRASSTGAVWSMLGGLSAVLALFVQPIQRGLADVPDLPNESLDFTQLQALENVAQWFNAQTVSLSAYVVCIALFVAGSLLFPDKPGSE